ncbi:hypothetical protein A2767_07535 [Candidatus Roizmanbacteria bacterium RIFCSPHIGHO2_01_FULL_35_10]|uniref:Ribulose-phosphate 3-epimerase n=1 Tax=Candidatus Roizmanbacteria bacterium RIFCSPLOWO2_01_FULL_35_13 TaxID=1802055 RepID=A0A1F7ICP6_9BACT|nr:MAG: hypothetical protein A2767_07535 [Candidatus Roizmanbacteria bacterium RIFCSPHIGHO2_01_FULL_35_10]OGK41121.1 MAG: hypothetical protein A3A74_02135 [Candidatus Roizmanbacteria bacterium RIFCSPLOWO2_01_FULL_35_13]
MKIIPAPLNYSVDEFIDLFNKLSPYFDTFQIDIQDGKFITNKTIDLKGYLEAFKKADQEKISASTFDFHFQTLNYLEDINLLSSLKDNLNIGTLLIHFSLSPNYQLLTINYPQFSFGIVLNPEDSVENLTKTYNLQTINCVQIMSVHPGPQGSPFIPDTLNKIEQLRTKNYRNKIFLDGAINKDTLPIIMSKKNKPDCLCIGSYLTKADNLKERVEYLKETVE